MDFQAEGNTFHSIILFTLEMFHLDWYTMKEKHLLDSFLSLLAAACFFLHDDTSSSESVNYKHCNKYRNSLLSCYTYLTLWIRHCLI